MFSDTVAPLIFFWNLRVERVSIHLRGIRAADRTRTPSSIRSVGSVAPRLIVVCSEGIGTHTSRKEGHT